MMKMFLFITSSVDSSSLLSLSLTTPTTALFLLLFLCCCCSSGVCKVVFDDCSFLKGCNKVERERLKKKEKLRNLDEKKGI